MKNNMKGITLIALIITIAVLLILAVVAIGVVKNNKIIEYAQKSKDSYTISQEKEEIRLALYEWNADNGISESNSTFKNVIENALQEKNASVIGENNGPLTVKFNKTGNTYTVAASGEKVNGWYDNGDGSYSKGDITIKIGETTYTNEEVREKLGATGGTYKGTWTVIGIEGEKIKLVSTSDVSQYIDLGKDDPNVFKKDENGNKTTTLKDEIVEIFDKEGQEETNLDLEKAIWSYKHVVETLDNYVKTATGIVSARSITIDDIEEKDILNITKDKKAELSSNYGKKFNYFFDTETSKVSSKNKSAESDKWSNIIVSSVASQIFVDKKGETVLIDSENDEITLDSNCYIYSRAFSNTKFSNILGTGRYWLASLCMECYGKNTEYFIRIVEGEDIMRREVFYSDGKLVNTGYAAVRAIVYI